MLLASVMRGSGEEWQDTAAFIAASAILRRFLNYGGQKMRKWISGELMRPDMERQQGV